MREDEVGEEERLAWLLPCSASEVTPELSFNGQIVLPGTKEYSETTAQYF